MMRKRLWQLPNVSRLTNLAPDCEDAAQMGIQEPEQAAQPAGDMEKASMLVRQMDRWIASMERLRLSDYVRYVDDRKRIFWSNFWGGIARGVGMAVGFTILGALFVLILQDLAKHNLPVIGDVLAQIVSVVQKRLE
ncbi:MAG: DUF5665 domain-containing protein [Clostridia bacterium]